MTGQVSSLTAAGCIIFFVFANFAATCRGAISVEAPAAVNGILTVEEHTPIRILCRGADRPGEVTWLREDNDVSDEEGVHASINSDGVAELHIDEAETEHEGRYTCQLGSVSSANAITVRVADSEKRLTIVTPPQTVEVNATVTLICTADIHSHIAWFHNNKQLKDGTTETDDESEHIKTLTLVLRSVTKADQGTYVCRSLHHEKDLDEVTLTVGFDSTRKTSAASSIRLHLHHLLMLIPLIYLH